MSRGKTQRRKGKGKRSGRNEPGASLRGHLMAKGFSAAMARQTLKVQKKHYRLSTQPTDIESQDWANSIRPQKEECLLINTPAEVRLKIWECCIRNLPCGRKPITVDRSKRQYNRDKKVLEGSNHKNFHAISKRQKFFDSMHPGFRAQMFNLSVICRQAYLDIVGGSLLFKLKAFRFTDTVVMANFFHKVEKSAPTWSLITKLYLDFEVRAVEEIKFVGWILRHLPGFVNLQKLDLRLKVCDVDEGYAENLLPQKVVGAITEVLEVWEWIDTGVPHNPKNYTVDISGDETWPVWINFGGDRICWHLFRNLDAIELIDVENLANELSNLYPNGLKDPTKGPTEAFSAPQNEPFWLEWELPLFTLQDAMKALEVWVNPNVVV